MKCDKCGHITRPTPLFRDKYNQPVYDLDPMIVVLQLRAENRAGVVKVVSEPSLMLALESEWNSDTDEYRAVYRPYYGGADLVLEGKRGERIDFIICLNKSMGEMQAEGKI